MRKILSVLSILFVAGFISLNAQCCDKGTYDGESDKSTVQNHTKTDVRAYYFHATRRCVTCQAVESVTKKSLQEYFGDQVEFSSINREKEKDNFLIKKYKVSGQALIIVKGDKVINLTNYAFMNARNHPDKLKAKIKTTVDSLL